jgi:hypothetical protein
VYFRARWTNVMEMPAASSSVRKRSCGSVSNVDHTKPA